MRNTTLKFLLLAVLCSVGVLHAQNSILEVMRWDNTRVRIELNQLSKITFSGSDVNLNLRNGQVTSIPTAEVRNFVFGTSTNVINRSQNRQITLYPNPAVDHIRISDLSSDVQFVAIYSLSGQMIQQVPVSGSDETISVSHLNRGIYFIKAGDAVLKFSKQ